ncbi:MAG: PKD domain-containing protein [Candidatus Wildermuthbacteria bacterium]|nr:PKD domain-containing protein [Candidatus Wildermuthbacteria bacterium]
MLDIKKKRKRLILIVILVVLATLLFFWLQRSDFLPQEVFFKKAPKVLEEDALEPASQIHSPASGSWQSRDFWIKILDEDLESGLDKTSCRYKVLSYQDNGQEHSSGWWSRKCNSLIQVAVGEGKQCSSEGERACWIFISSEDKAQNQHIPSGEKGSVKYYNIDWTPPKTGKVSTQGSEAKVQVVDNLKITGCSLYLDGRDLGPMAFISPGCQKECEAFKTFSAEFESGEHRLWAVCRDAARNYNKSEELVIKENLPPTISSCRVTPAQGTKEAEFRFFAEATDPDGDELSFLWDFGDGTQSTEKTPSYKYSSFGTYTPRVSVQDPSGESALCNTAWVVVNE